VIRWQIWLDGDTLFHSIDTTGGYDRMVEAITSLGPIDPAWDERIASLLDSDPGSDTKLSLVWAMDEHGQRPGRER